MLMQNTSLLTFESISNSKPFETMAQNQYPAMVAVFNCRFHSNELHEGDPRPSQEVIYVHVGLRQLETTSPIIIMSRDHEFYLVARQDSPSPSQCSSRLVCNISGDPPPLLVTTAVDPHLLTCLAIFLAKRKPDRILLWLELCARSYRLLPPGLEASKEIIHLCGYPRMNRW